MAKSIEVFRDLYLRGPAALAPDLVAALIAAASEPWRYDPERSATLARNALGDAEILAFERRAADGLPAAGLTLWSTEGGYYVPNIVPLVTGELGIARYNAILADFIERVAGPVAPRFDYEVDATLAQQDLEDWTSADAARKLRIFSDLANKSTRASHPMDQRRWFDFIIAVHRSESQLDPDRLARWLHEIEEWDEDSAHDLAGRYENALSLLRHYDDQ